MTYALETEKQTNKSIFLVRLLAGFWDADVTWLLYSGSIYYIPWTFSEELTEGYTLGASKDSLAVDEYIIENGFLYYRFSGAPGFALPISFYIYLASSALYFHKVPTDSASGVTYFPSYVLRAPTFTQSIENLQDGFFEITASGLQINNADHWFNKYLHHHVSFNRRAINVWHMLGENEVNNVKPVFRGFSGDISYSENEIGIRTYFEVSELDKQILPDSFDFRYTESNSNIFPNTAQVEPTRKDIFINEVYGFCRNIPATNISYEKIETTSNNRTWGVCAGGSGRDAIGIWKIATVKASPSSNVNNTFVVDASGIQIGDTVWFDKGTTEYRQVINIDHLNNIVSHASLSVACVGGDLIKVARVGQLTVVHEGISYLCMFKRDYNTPEPGASLKHTAIEFVSNFESNVGMPTPLSVNDLVLAEHVYGTMERATINAVPFGDLDNEYGTNSKSESLIYLMLRNAGINESDINTSTFTDLQSDIDNNFLCGFRNPTETAGEPVTFKEVITKLLISSTTFLYFDNDLKWSIGRLKPFSYNSAIDTKADSNNIINGSLSILFKYSDIFSSTIVKHSFREIGIFEQRAQWERIEIQGDVAVLLHFAPKSKEIESYLLDRSQAGTLCGRMQSFYDHRRAIVSINGFFGFFQNVINSTIRIERDDMPGFDYVAGNLRTIDLKVVGIAKNSNGITLSLNDLKGIQQNPGDF